MGADVYLQLFNLKRYRGDVGPALRRYSEERQVDLLIRLLADCITASRNTSVLNSPEMLQESIDILAGRIFYGPALNHVRPFPEAVTARADLDDFVRQLVANQLLQCICVVHENGEALEQNMSRTGLIPYLYGHSAWLELAFTGSLLDNGERLDYPLGEHAEIVLRADVEKIECELRNIPDSGAQLIDRQLQRLRRIVARALDDEDAALLLSIQ